MSFDSDVALLGTGVAPLIAAKRLMEEGKSVLLLNPERDFFKEDSELPLDPLWPTGPTALTPQRLVRSSAENVIAALRPDFPGAIEQWPYPEEGGFHDDHAPHVRNRARLWLRRTDSAPRMDWEAMEDMYVEASDAGLNPQILEGFPAFKRFPGAALKAQSEEFRGILIPKLSDVDVDRYRNGLLEFVRDRLPGDRIVHAALQVELMPEGIRFHSDGTPKTARLRDALLVFWTPRLTSWILAQAKEAGVSPLRPRGLRLWEQWCLLSRDRLDPSIVGAFEDLSVWADLEGAPAAPLHRLNVLRPGPLVQGDGIDEAVTWASSESFDALSRLCHDFLCWEKFSIQSMRPRAIYEWDRLAPCDLVEGALLARVVPGCDGPMADVVRNARHACDFILNEPGASAI